ncbi:hypothetical protein ASZ90_002657 [hydrocarbon metagenome]|uniref:Uncharacterized protein n=1 Tax=hydrocarbon metagenome TaxID=938273 RepID=A0A0W8G343_9ZZZZ
MPDFLNWRRPRTTRNWSTASSGLCIPSRGPATCSAWTTPWPWPMPWNRCSTMCGAAGGMWTRPSWT